MGGLTRRIKQGIKIKTLTKKAANGGIERTSRVNVDKGAVLKDEVKLGVRIRSGQKITKFMLDKKDIFSIGYDTQVEQDLAAQKRFEMDGEEWRGWRISTKQLPANLGNFPTEFALTPADPEGQTVMWAVVYAGDPEGFASEHVYIGYADVSA